MKNLIIYCFILQLFACRESNKALLGQERYLTEIESSKIDSLISICDCKNEYDFVRLFSYYHTYCRNCIRSRCKNIENPVDDSFPKVEIVLNLKIYPPLIYDETDTIYFSIGTYTAKDCWCVEFNDARDYTTTPSSKIGVIKSINSLFYVGNMDPYLYSYDNLIEKIKGDTIMQKEVIGNSKKYDAWFVQKVKGLIKH